MIIISLVGEKSWPFIEFPLGESVRLWALTLTRKRGGGEGVQQARKGSGEKEKQLVPLSSQPRCVRQERWEVQGQQAGLTCRGVSYFRLPTVISYWGWVKILPAHMSWWGINSSSPSRQIQDLCWRFLKEPGLDVRLKDHTDNQPESHPGPTILLKHASWVCSLLASSRNHSRADTIQTPLSNVDSSRTHPATPGITLKSQSGGTPHLLGPRWYFSPSHPSLLPSITSCFYPVPCSSSSEWLGLDCFLQCFIGVENCSSSKPRWCYLMPPFSSQCPQSPQSHSQDSEKGYSSHRVWRAFKGVKTLVSRLLCYQLHSHSHYWTT